MEKLVLYYEALARKAKVYERYRLHSTFKDIVKLKRTIAKLEKTTQLRSAEAIRRANWAKQKIKIMNELNERSNARVQKKIDKLHRNLEYLSKQIKPII